MKKRTALEDPKDQPTSNYRKREKGKSFACNSYLPGRKKRKKKKNNLFSSYEIWKKSITNPTTLKSIIAGENLTKMHKMA